ncbi:transcriptional regulator, IclR family [Roseomonas rosea]|uniref:Transcriptional regulator, IclR family n=2 Tax=Muricoccus roseus TaxID=198092 RepID=A0A1M6I7D2_9PROT|nr:transcriptional regulator, IclR family [Roseomonas rosea]
MADDALKAVKSADRVLTLFELLGRWGREMSHSQIAEALDIPKSSLTQLLRNLVAREWLRFSPLTKGYSLGPAIEALARRAMQARDLVQLAQPILATLTATVGESSALNLLKGDMAEVAATVLGPQRLVSHMRLGDVAPLYATSGGKVILAFLPREMQEDYLSRVVFEPSTPRTLRDPAALRRQLATIRRRRTGHSIEEWTPGIVGIAQPVLTRAGSVLGAINVAMPRLRYDKAGEVRIIEALARATAALSERVEGAPPA